jgi:hypothetical protein
MPKIVLNAVQKVLEPLPIRGKAYIADAILKHVTSAIECHPVPGVTISLRPRQHIERRMWAGGYERDLVRLLRQTLKPGMIVLDLGDEHRLFFGHRGCFGYSKRTRPFI